jgi:hypothetical protein
MDESEFRSLTKWQISVPPCYFGNRIQYLLKTEEQILQSISARAPIYKILNDVCNALDCQIGNMVSLISTPDEILSGAAEASRSAACVSRNPSPREFQLIEWAVCLAAAATKRHRQTIDGGNCRIHAVRRARGYVPETPNSKN